MTTKKFRFTAYGATGILRPQIPIDLPISKNVWTLIDSGASQSLMSIDMLVHEKKIIAPHSPGNIRSEGICGKNCLEISGISEPITFAVSDFPKPITLSFIVVAQKHRLDSPILGCDFFTQINVAFKKEAGKTIIELSD